MPFFVRPLSLALATAAAAAIIVPAIAASRTPVQQARHDKFEGFGEAMKAISASLKSGKPDAAMINARAKAMAADGPQIVSWFPAGSGKSAGKTEAKNAIWAEPAAFKAAADAFTAAAQGLVAASASGDAAAIAAATQKLGGTCKGCHEKFREEI